MPTRSIEVDRDTFEKVAAEAEYLGVEPGEVLEIAHKKATPPLGFVNEPDDLEALTICPECRAWTRLPECWRCEIDLPLPPMGIRTAAIDHIFKRL